MRRLIFGFVLVAVAAALAAAPAEAKRKSKQLQNASCFDSALSSAEQSECKQRFSDASTADERGLVLKDFRRRIAKAKAAKAAPPAPAPAPAAAPPR